MRRLCPMLSVLFLTTVATLEARGDLPIDYDCSVTPDQCDFSWKIRGVGGWWVEDGELHMVTSQGIPGNDYVWFGNVPEDWPYWVNNPDPWPLPSDSVGLYLSIAMRQVPGSEDWDFRHKNDLAYGVEFKLLDDYSVRLAAGVPTDTLFIDTTVEHQYAALLRNGLTTYWIDGRVVYSGASADWSQWDVPPHVVIGDDSGIGLDCIGELIVNHVFIETGEGYVHPCSVEDPQPWPTLKSTATPNPFSASTRIEYLVPDSQRAWPVLVTVHDVTGRLVRMLLKTTQLAGPHCVSWDGRDHTGRRVAQGVYFCRLSVGGDKTTELILLVR